MNDGDLETWFVREVLAQEAALTRFIRRNWHNGEDVPDIRQDIYARVYTAARSQLPRETRAFLFATARNYLINAMKRSQIVPIDLIADLERLEEEVDDVTPERQATARKELKRMHAALEQLPPRLRHIVRLRRIAGLSTREVAAQLGIAPNTVDQQMVHGMRALTDFMLGGTGKLRRPMPRLGAPGSVKR